MCSQLSWHKKKLRYERSDRVAERAGTGKLGVAHADTEKVLFGNRLRPLEFRQGTEFGDCRLAKGFAAIVAEGYVTGQSHPVVLDRLAGSLLAGGLRRGRFVDLVVVDALGVKRQSSLRIC